MRAALLIALFAALQMSAQPVFSVGYCAQDDGGQNNFQLTADSGFIMVVAARTGANSRVTYLVKLDASGNQQWTRSLPISGPLYTTAGPSVSQLHDGGYIVATNYYELDSTTSQWRASAYLVRTDSAGNALWSRLYRGDGYSLARCVKETNDHGFIVCGETKDSVSFNPLADAFLFKTDSMGNLQWHMSCAYNAGTVLEYFQSVIETSTGDFVACGLIAGDGFLVKTNASGTLLWSSECPQPDFLADVQELPNGDFLTLGPNANSAGTAMYRVTPAGTTVWSKAYLSDSNLIGYSFVQTWDGFTVACNHNYSSAPGGLLHFDYSGTPIWSRAYTDAEGIFQPEVLLAPDGGYAFSGHNPGTTSTDISFIVIKTDSAGVAICNDYSVGGTAMNITGMVANTVGVTTAGVTAPITTTTTPVTLLPATLCLSTLSTEIATVPESINVYPNPANERITLETSFVSYDRTRVRICDITGRTVLEDDLRSGRQEVDMGALNPGMYFLLIENHGIVIAQKPVIRN